MNDVKIVEDNTEAVLSMFHEAIMRGLTMVGMKIEKYAKALCPVGTPESTGKKGYRGGTLKNSITYEVDADARTVTVGTNVEYAPYVELGTGPFFTPPPEWETFGTEKGQGIGHGYVRPRPYLRPAIEDHIKKLQDIIINELKKG